MNFGTSWRYQIKCHAILLKKDIFKEAFANLLEVIFCNIGYESYHFIRDWDRGLQEIWRCCTLLLLSSVRRWKPKPPSFCSRKRGDKVKTRGVFFLNKKDTILLGIFVYFVNGHWLSLSEFFSYRQLTILLHEHIALSHEMAGFFQLILWTMKFVFFAFPPYFANFLIG